MRNETIGVLDLRRNLSALLETTQRRPLMVHRYGSPWVCVVSDAQWQQQAVLLDFDPQSHPLAMLLRLQQQVLPLAETGVLPPAALARALLLMDMHGIRDLAQLHEQVLHHRLWHWFVAGTRGVMDGWQLPAVRIAMALWCDDVDMTDALVAFAARSDVAVLARRCGGDAPRLQREACRRMTLR
ncbi:MULTISPECIES: hypothetical protein [Stenotrophomonas]|jgi:hypothetical protein|uniref:hypothetical protein n=1 Tax=Stenotrophomonas TaxID=40323 RepID=UPI000DA702EA|nr:MULTISPECIES: hypothetical protein [Stenotrophomonas]MBH1512409.1 hypothetical protein [Stenotrophomonas maltophilia]MBH1545199.1 hypothetical protein [Stenotrophomonas maltophilia]MBH1860915.1 hypothetical protein [Stenotrophomonas maltophilia]MBN5063932.1 hypothetical protein [Stenotrophomonas maltophilia]MCU1036116.1 hypothetical protein [Stenotrophomonas maltophilia]